jgi:outer membrane lipoprotein SlyB
MSVVTRQLGSTRISPLVVAVATSAAIASLIGLGALTGVATSERAPMRDEVPLPKAEPKPSQQGPCALCGTIESIRAVEVLEQPAASAGAADSGNGAEAGAATSVLDTLSSVVAGNAAEKNVRKRLVYRVTLHMDDGSFRAISLSSPPVFAVGDKVRVVESRLVRA